MAKLHRPGCPGRSSSGWALMALIATLVAGGCQDPQGTDGDPQDVRLAPGAGRLEFQLDRADGTPSGLRLVAQDVRLDAVAHVVRAQVAIHNPGSISVPGPGRVAVTDFRPRDVAPLNAEALPGIPELPPLWAFDHRGTYGDEGVLGPGQTSTPIQWIFSVPSGESFAFRAHVLDGLGLGDGLIAGAVFADRNGDGQRQDGEPGLAGAVVQMEHEGAVLTQQTGADGWFRFAVAAPGLYRLSRPVTNDCAPTTPVDLEVLIVRRQDGSLSSFRGAHFGCRDLVLPGSVRVFGVVFLDGNRDGVRDPNEPGVAGVQVSGATLACPTFAPILTWTDPNGRYELQLPGCQPPYEVARVGDGFLDTTPNPVVLPGPPPAGGFEVHFGVAAPDTACSRSPDELVQALVQAYEQRDHAGFAALLSGDPQAEFVFYLAEPGPDGETHWGLAEELRLHARMFEPQNVAPGDVPVPPELWLAGVQVDLVRTGEWAERTDLYRTDPAGPGLDPARWIARGAVYQSWVLLDLQGDTDFLAAGRQAFVVLEDRTRGECDPGRFRVYLWEDLGSLGQVAAHVGGGRTSAEEASWSRLKSLYR